MQRRITWIAGVCLCTMLQRLSAQAPLIAFSTLSNSTARPDTVFVRSCYVAVTLEGTSGFEGGWDLGASAVVRGDRLDVRVGTFQSQLLAPRDPFRVDWRMLIGSLPARRLFLRVFLNDRLKLTQWVELPYCRH